MQKQRYGISQFLDDDLLAPLNAEIDVFKKWRCVGVNINRTRPVECIEEDTFNEGDLPRIKAYTGFVHRFILDKSTDVPTLDWYTQVCRNAGAC